MFELELYFDDSGTDAGTPVAVAACYVAKKSQWVEFVRNWDEIREQEGFDMFHMAEFVAKPEMGHKPFCDWDTEKKKRVYRRLVSVINTRVRKGFGVAVPKQPYDDYVFDEFRGFAENHFVFAVRTLLGFINNWRDEYSLTEPMKYVFELGSPGEAQLHQIWKTSLLHQFSKERYGIVPEGVMFQNKRAFRALQAADILAWQMQNNMRRTVIIGRDPLDRRLAHPGFLMLRDNRPIELLFYGRQHLKQAFDRTRAYHEEKWIWPWEQGSGAFLRVTRTDPGPV